MEILHEFGVDWVLLGAQIINFLIVFFILKKFLYKPVLEMLQNRQKTIKQGLEAAEKSQKLLEETQEKERKVLQLAQTEAKKLLADVRSEREKILQEAQNETKKQTEVMLKEAREQIQHDTEEAERRLTKRISTLAVDILEKTTKDLFSPEDQKEVIKRAVKKLNVK